MKQATAQTAAKSETKHMDQPPASVQLTAAIWYRIVKMLPLHDRFDPALACKRLLEATSPWQAPVFVVVPSSGAAGEEKSSRAQMTLGVICKLRYEKLYPVTTCSARRNRPGSSRFD